jgi:hypothetical protein
VSDPPSQKKRDGGLREICRVHARRAEEFPNVVERHHDHHHAAQRID